MPVSPKWSATMTAALKDQRSSMYDKTIQTELDEYQRRFASTPGFSKLSFALFKALMLTESGGPTSAAWNTKPCQIGNLGDPGYAVLVDHAENSAIIMSPQLQADIASKPINAPILNIRAAIALTLVKAALFRRQSEVDATDQSLHEHIVIKGDSFGRISRTERTTVPEIKLSNPTVGANLKPKQKLNFHRAHMVTQIIGWRPITPQFLADYYNGGGDPLYAEKISFVMEKIQ